MSDATGAVTCPYVGLRPYTEAERAFFFGRERDQRVVASNLYSAPLTVFYGTSGVGKSSVLLAGVVPALRARPRTAVVVFREWHRPDFLPALKAAAVAAFPPGSAATASTDAPLDEIIAALSRAVHGTALIVFDQFEEYFLYHPDTPAGDAFESEFAVAVNHPALDVGFLVSLREDSLARLDRFRLRIPNLLSNTIRLAHLDAHGAEDAIRRPVAVYNAMDPMSPPVIVEDGLVERVIAELGEPDAQGGTVQASILQLVLTRLWQEEIAAGSHVLRLSTLAALGGARELAQRHLAEVMAHLDADDRHLCAQFFDRMVTPSGAKIACRVRDLQDWAQAPAGRVAEVLSRLAAERVLNYVAPQGEDAQDAQYEIFHDVLAPAILEWRRAWIEAERQAEHERELQAAQARADEQAAVARRMRRLAVGLGFATVLAALATIAALIAQQAADFQRRQKTELALSVQLVATALRHLDVDPEVSAHAALQALERTRDADAFVRAQAEDAARRALDATRLRLTMDAKAGRVHAVAFSPDGLKAASAGQDGAVRVWDAASGAEFAVLKGHEDEARDLAFSPDGASLVSVGYDGRTILWDLARAALLRELPRQEQALRGVAFSPDGELIATVGRNPVVRIWDADTGGLLMNLSGHKAEVRAVAFSPDGRRLATAGWEPSVRVWNMLSGRVEHVLDGHADKVFAVAFSPDGRWLASASQDRSARLWNVASGALVRELPEQPDTVYAVAFSPDGGHLATGGFDGSARLWDVGACTRPQGDCEPLVTLNGHENYVHGLAFDPAGARLATAGWDGAVKLWDVAFAHAGAIYDLAFSPDGSRLASASLDTVAQVWDAAGGRPLQRLEGHTNTVFRVAWSPDGSRVATASFDGSAAVWEAGASVPPLVLKGHQGRVVSVAFSRDGREVLTAGRDGMTGVWDARTGARRLWSRASPGPVNRALFTPDRQGIVTAAADGAIAEWSAADGKLRRRLQERGDEIHELAFGPDGRLLATAGADRVLRLWDFAAGRTLHELHGHSGAVVGLDFSPDGRLVASASRDRSARVWDVANGAERFALPQQSSEVNAVAFSPDGALVVTGGGDKRVHVYPLEAGPLAAALRERVAHDFTPDECAKYLREHPCPP